MKKRQKIKESVKSIRTARSPQMKENSLTTAKTIKQAERLKN